MRHGSRCGDRRRKPCKKRIRPGTEGLAANVDRVLRRLGWSWKDALEVKTAEKVSMSPSAQKDIGNTQFGKKRENGGFDKQETEKQQHILEKLDFQMPTRLLREKH